MDINPHANNAPPPPPPHLWHLQYRLPLPLPHQPVNIGGLAWLMASAPDMHRMRARENAIEGIEATLAMRCTEYLALGPPPPAMQSWMHHKFCVTARHLLDSVQEAE